MCIVGISKFTVRVFVICRQEERRRTGRYVAGGAVLAIMLLAVHQALLRDASTIAGVCIPAIIMISYIIWILYSAHRDRRKVTCFKSNNGHYSSWPQTSICHSFFWNWTGASGFVKCFQQRYLRIYWIQSFSNFCENFFPVFVVKYFVNFIDNFRWDKIGMAAADLGRENLFYLSLVFFFFFFFVEIDYSSVN